MYKWVLANLTPVGNPVMTSFPSRGVGLEIFFVTETRIISTGLIGHWARKQTKFFTFFLEENCNFYFTSLFIFSTENCLEGWRQVSLVFIYCQHICHIAAHGIGHLPWPIVLIPRSICHPLMSMCVLPAHYAPLHSAIISCNYQEL